MTNVTVNRPNLIITTNSASTVGPIGPAGASGSPNACNTVADISGASFGATTKIVQVLGYYAAGDAGGFWMRRVNSQPAHLWRFRTTDRYKLDGTTDNTNGGWWEGYPVDGVNLYVTQFGVKADASTDDYSAYATLIDYAKRTGVHMGPDGTDNPPRGGYCIHLARGTSRSSQTLAFENVNSILGVAGIDGDFNWQLSQIVFPINTAGLKIYNFPSAPDQDGTASSSVLKGFTVRSDAYGAWGSGTSWDGVPRHGIEIHAVTQVENVAAIGFGGHGIAIYGKTGAWYDPLAGSGDSQVFTKLDVSDNALNGLHIQGNDANGCTFIGVVASANCGWGVYDGGQLGNKHIQHTFTGNGNPYKVQTWNRCIIVHEGGKWYLPYPQQNTVSAVDAAALAINRPSTSPTYWYVAKIAAAQADIVNWGQCLYNNVVYNVVPGQEANMWTSQPDTHPLVWTSAGAPVGGQYYINWKLNWQPYGIGGDFGQDGEVWYGSVDTCYHEPIFDPNFPPNYYGSPNGIVFGGQWSNYRSPGTRSVYYEAVNGFRVSSGEMGVKRTNPKSDPVFWGGTSTKTYYVQLGGAGDNAPILTWTYDGSGEYGFRFNDGTVNKDWVFDYGNYSGWYMYGNGHDSADPYTLLINKLSIGRSGQFRRLGADTAAPASGTWAAGDFCVNNGTSGPIGWRCTVAGAPGTWVAEWSIHDGLTNAANDAAAAGAGVAIGQPYRNGSVLMVRVT